MSMITWMPPTRCAVLHAVTTRAELVAAFAELYPAGWQALQAQTPGELGAVVAVYHRIGDPELVLSAGVEVRADFEPQPPLARIDLGDCEAGRIEHFGPYVFDDFRRTQAEIETFLEQQGRVPRGIIVERYLTVPDEEPDQSKWHTEIWLPLE